MLPRWGKKLDKMFEEIEQVFEDMDAHFERVFEDGPNFGAYRIEKGKDQVTIFVEVPGCASKDVKVALAESIVTVEASSPLGGTRTFKFRIGSKIDISDIAATVKDGLLTLVVKRDEQPAPPSGSVKVTQG